MFLNGVFSPEEVREMYTYTKDTNDHIRRVNLNMIKVCDWYREHAKNLYYEPKLKELGILHDSSKLNDQLEKEGYIKMNIELKKVEYGTEDYKKIMNKYNDIIQLHYQNNPHHPEHYSEGYNGMTILNKIEMVCDWCAVIQVKKLYDTYEKSFNFNKQRFNIPDDEFIKIMNLTKYLLFNEELEGANFINDLIQLGP